MEGNIIIWLWCDQQMEVWQNGRPHILLVTSRPIEKFEVRTRFAEMVLSSSWSSHVVISVVTSLAIFKLVAQELLVDYGDEYWASFLKSHRAAKHRRCAILQAFVTSCSKYNCVAQAFMLPQLLVVLLSRMRSER